MAKGTPTVENLRCICKRKINDKLIVATKCKCDGFDMKTGRQVKVNVHRFLTVR